MKCKWEYWKKRRVGKMRVRNKNNDESSDEPYLFPLPGFL